MKPIAHTFRSAFASLKALDLLLTFGGIASVGLLRGAGGTVAFTLLHSQSTVTTDVLSEIWAFRLTGIGALLAVAGVAACQFLEDGSLVRRSLFFLYAGAFLASAFVLLLHLFGVSGASGSRS
jgi:hypothetical protein